MSASGGFINPEVGNERRPHFATNATALILPGESAEPLRARCVLGEQKKRRTESRWPWAWTLPFLGWLQCLRQRARQCLQLQDSCVKGAATGKHINLRGSQRVSEFDVTRLNVC